jgi:hypothetical protein
MLVRPGNDRPFPTNDLSFVTFVTTAYRDLIRLQLSFEPTERSLLRRETHGFLHNVPILSHLSLPVQVDLLAQTWSRHYARRVFRANLLDGAVIFAACRDVAEAFQGDPSFTLIKRDITRDIDIRLDKWTFGHISTLYGRWWGSFEPGLVHSLSDVEGFPQRMAAPLEEAQHLTAVSSNVARNLSGLMPPAEIGHWVRVLTRAEDQP